MMDDIQEQTELANEISNAISNPVGFGESLSLYLLSYPITG